MDRVPAVALQDQEPVEPFPQPAQREPADQSGARSLLWPDPGPRWSWHRPLPATLETLLAPLSPLPVLHRDLLRLPYDVPLSQAAGQLSHRVLRLRARHAPRAAGSPA